MAEMIFFLCVLLFVCLAWIYRTVANAARNDDILDDLEPLFETSRRANFFESDILKRPDISGTIDSLPVAFTHVSASKGKGYHIPESLSIKLLRGSPANFKVSKRSLLQDTIPFLKGLQTGDPDFDQKFHVACKASELARAFFSEKVRRDAITGIFGCSYNVKLLSGNAASTTIYIETLPNILHPEGIRRLIALLAQLETGRYDTAGQS